MKFIRSVAIGPSWNSRQLCSFKNFKNKYFKKYRISDSSFWHLKYFVPRAMYNRLNIQLYKNYIESLKSNFLRNPKLFYMFVQDLVKPFSKWKTWQIICLETSLPIHILYLQSALLRYCIQKLPKIFNILWTSWHIQLRPTQLFNLRYNFIYVYTICNIFVKAWMFSLEMERMMLNFFIIDFSIH